MMYLTSRERCCSIKKNKTNKKLLLDKIEKMWYNVYCSDNKKKKDKKWDVMIQ